MNFPSTDNILYKEVIYEKESEKGHWTIINKYDTITLLYYEDTKGNVETESFLSFEAFEDLIDFCKKLDEHDDTH